MNNKHYSALLKKDITVQLRKKKTNIGFFVFSALLLIILVALQYTINSQDDGTNYVYNNTGAIVAPQVQYCQQGSCYPWFSGWYVDASQPSDAAGSLPNSTFNHTGLLGNITQLPLYDVVPGLFPSLIPFFVKKDSPEEIDSEIVAVYSNIQPRLNQIEKDWPSNYTSNATYNSLYYSFPSAAIIFNELSLDNKRLDYTVQTPDYYWGYWNYYQQIVVNMVNNAYLKSILPPNATVSIVSTSTMTFPYYTSYTDFDISALIGLFFVPFVLTLPQVLHLFILVSEKHERQLEMMKMMGMRTREYWATTYVFGYIMYGLMALFVLIVYLVCRMDIIAHANPMTYLLFLFLYGHAQVSFSLLLSTFFWKPVTALIVGILVNMFGVAPIAALGAFSWFNIPTFLLLFAPISVTRAWSIICVPFVQTPPLLTEEAIYLDRYSPLVQTFVFMIISTVLCIILAVYLDKVLPREHGVNKSPFYPIIALYNKIKQGRKMSDEDNERIPLVTKSVEVTSHLDDVSVQTGDEDCERERAKVTGNSEMLMKIVDLSKKYPKSDKFSLFGFSLGLEEGECLGLLGPNGAGKTTLISMLCGLTKPTSGYALVQGHSILTDLQGVHELLGFCPQHDILWPDMTVEEHLLFYCALKNHGGDIAYLHVQRLAHEIGLSGEHLHKRVSQLSTGMKRRLSTGIALVGSSRVVLLDEPTAGLDHRARRAVWDIIERQKKAGRSFIITTHDMSEADVLCTRIAIISQGRLQNVGSPGYLKNKFGNGFNLKLSVESISAVNQVKNCFAQYLPAAVLSSQAADQLEFMINDPNTNLAEVSTVLEDYGNQCGILEWSINPTSLEQVFLQLAHNDEIKE